MALQRLGLARAFEGRAPTLLDQRVEPLQSGGIVRDPVLIVSPGMIRKDNLHAALRSRSRPSPRSSCTVASRSRAVFAGVDTRCIVSAYTPTLTEAADVTAARLASPGASRIKPGRKLARPTRTKACGDLGFPFLRSCDSYVDTPYGKGFLSGWF